MDKVMQESGKKLKFWNVLFEKSMRLCGIIQLRVNNFCVNVETPALLESKSATMLGLQL